MPFQQAQLAKEFNQTRGIFDKFAYKPTNGDVLTDIVAEGYFNEARFINDKGWSGSLIEVLINEDFYILLVEGGTATQISSSSSSGLNIPASAPIPFATTSARDTWASSHLDDLINSSTAVNVTDSSWFIWRGETNPESYDSELWVNGDQIVKGQQGPQGIQGIQGIQGEQGIQGIQGEQGNPGVVQSIVAGDNVTVNSADPANPIISSTGSGGITLFNIEGNQSNELLIGSEMGHSFNEETGKSTIYANVQPNYIYVGPLKTQNLIPGAGLSTTYNEGTETTTMNVDSTPDPNPVFNTVTSTLFLSETYGVIKAKDGLALQDDTGDYGFWDRNQGLRLQGQGSVTSRITAAENIEIIADNFTVNKHNNQTLFSSDTIDALVLEMPYRAIDDIVGGLTELIQNENTQAKAVGKLCDTLYSLGHTSAGKISISTVANKLGLLPPVESEGYGVLYFDYIKGNVNMVLLKWEDESGKIHEGVMSETTWHSWSKPLSSIVSTDQFNSKSGYNRSSMGGGSTHNIEFWENGTIFKLSNSTINVKLLEGMHDVDGQRHGYVKYINSKGADVAFNWYDRSGNKITNSTVPSICPPDTVVEIYANYTTDDYFINISQAKVIAGLNEEDQLLEGLASGFLYCKTIEVG